MKNCISRRSFLKAAGILGAAGALAACNAAGAGDDQQRGQVAHEHGADMLQAQGDGLAQRHLAIKLVSSLFKFDFLQMFHSPQNLDVLGFGCFAKSGFIITKLPFNVN